ncbi:hypothetical protein B9J90_05020 [Vibrio sp. V09_P4A23P171]|nr:hypothetical protein B9J92_02295 [Vibrio sp. V08_P9A1T1]OXX37700.1 hypothetical protein B9J90_05020 [Vibrio sp. V09_P4A23P171]
MTYCKPVLILIVCLVSMLRARVILLTGKASIVTTSIATLFTTNATDFLQFDVNQKLKKKILVILRFTRDLYHAIK